MRKILLLLIVCSFSAFGLSPKRSVEQLYQHYANNAPGVIFEATGSEQIISSRLMQVVKEDQKLTPEGNVGYLDGDPLCDCQEYGNLVLEHVDIVAKDARHVDAIVRFRRFDDNPETVTQTLVLVNENGRWLIDDIVNESSSLYQKMTDYNREREAEAQRDKAADNSVASPPSPQPSP